MTKAKLPLKYPVHTYFVYVPHNTSFHSPIGYFICFNYTKRGLPLMLFHTSFRNISFPSGVYFHSFSEYLFLLIHSVTMQFTLKAYSSIPIISGNEYSCNNHLYVYCNSSHIWSSLAKTVIDTWSFQISSMNMYECLHSFTL